MAAPNLVIQTAFVGDLLLTIPLLRQLKEAFPDHPIHLLCRKGLGSVLIKLGLVDHVVEMDKSTKTRRRSVMDQLEAQAYHWIICPHRSFTSASIVSSLQAEKKIGYKQWWNFLRFNERVARPIKFPEVIRQLVLLKAHLPELKENLDRSFDKLQSLDTAWPEKLRESQKGFVPAWASLRVDSMQLPTLSNESVRCSFKKVAELAERQLGKDYDRNTVLLAPGSVWETKKWPYYKELALQLQTVGWQVVFIGAPNEGELCESLASAIGAVSLAGQTDLFETYLLMEKCRGLVCNDSGAMHLAAVAGLPTVAIFGPTTLSLGYRPWQNQALVVEHDLNCRPCGLHGGHHCPIGTHACMRDIAPETVFASFNKLLAN